MNRIRLTKSVISSRKEAETVLGELASHQAALNAATAELDTKITAIRSEYEGTIDTLKKQIELKSGLLQQWAEGAPEEFSEKKSIDFLHGRIGFRTGNPQLKTLSGWTFKRVLEVIARTFIRVKEKLDKEAILGAYARGELTENDLRACGLRVIQDEAFYVEPKLEQEAA